MQSVCRNVGTVLLVTCQVAQDPQSWCRESPIDIFETRQLNPSPLLHGGGVGAGGGGGGFAANYGDLGKAIYISPWVTDARSLNMLVQGSFGNSAMNPSLMYHAVFLVPVIFPGSQEGYPSESLPATQKPATSSEKHCGPTGVPGGAGSAHSRTLHPLPAEHSDVKPWSQSVPYVPGFTF